MIKPLTLSNSDLVAQGMQRAVYLHPSDRTKLVKVLRPEADRPVRNNFNGVMDRLLPGTRIRQIRKEYGEYLRIMLKNIAPGFHAPMAHMFGFVGTSRGLGCLTERVMTPQGDLGDTLSTKLQQGTLTADDLDLLNDTIARLFRYGVRAGDLNASNFVFGHRDNGTGPGPRECVLVDGFGDIHAIPVRSMAGWANRMGLNDSCKRLARNTTGLTWHPQTQQFTLL